MADDEEEKVLEGSSAPVVVVGMGQAVKPEVVVGMGQAVKPEVVVGMGQAVKPEVVVGMGQALKPEVVVGMGQAVKPEVVVGMGQAVKPEVVVGMGQAVKPVVVVGMGQAVKLDGQVSNADHKSRSPLPCASIKTKLDSERKKISEKRESIASEEIKEERQTDCCDKQREPSVLLQNVIFENVALAPPVGETMKVANKNKVTTPIPAPTGPGPSINDENSKMASKHSKDSTTDEVMELKTPEAAKKHSERMIRIGDNAWNRKDYLDKVHLKAMNSSEMMSLRGKELELERKTSIGPCAVGTNERPSGISISIPRKSSNNFTETVSRPIKPTGISLSKKSTSDLKSRVNPSSLQEREDMRAFTYFTHTPTPTMCNIRKDKDHHVVVDNGDKGDTDVVPTIAQAEQFCKDQNNNCFIKLRNRIGGFFDKIKRVLN